MRVNYLNLKNFSSIYTGLKAKEIKIDFTTAKNKIILFEGPNGIGKTSILSTIHPFATNGTFDERSDAPLIIEKEEGYKEIHIEDDSNIYIIKHFYYSNKETHTIKSYVEKNGIELNINGNVTSFKEIIAQELDLEMDYLKLIRLGSNVKGFIDEKSTERKAFMGKLLSDVDLYLLLHKKMSKDISILKTIISHNINKINKLNIEDVDLVDREIDILNDSIITLDNEIVSLKSNKAIADHELSKLPSLLELKTEIKEKEKELIKANKLIDKINLDNINIDDDIEKTSNDIIRNTANLSILQEKINLYKNNLNDAITSKKMLLIELDKETSKEDISSLEKIVFDLNKFVNKSDAIFNDYKPEYTKDELETVMNVIFNNQRILDITYEFGEKPVRKVIKLMKNNHNVQEFVSSKLNIISGNKMLSNSNYVIDNIMRRMGIVYAECGNTKCRIYQFWKELKLVSKNKMINDDDIEDEEFYNYVSLAYNNIKNVFLVFGDNKVLFEKMPLEIQEMFRLKNIYEKISKCEIIYDRDVLYNYLTKITEYENYLNKKEQLMSYKKELEEKRHSSNKKIILQQLENMNNNIDDLSKKSLITLDEFNMTSDKLKSLMSKKDELILVKAYLDNKELISGNLTNLNNQLSDCIKLKEQSEALTKLISLSELESNKKKLKINELKYKVKEFKEISKELNKIQDEYSDMCDIRDALSSKEGIPLLYINMYLRKTIDLTNDLLDIIYGGRFYIKTLKAQEDKFPIPYVNNGIIIKDIYHASQGEKSMTSVALSFALSCQNLSKYNIMLLDEIDSTLDAYSRKNFIKLLETIIEIVNTEQVFVISHNDMFDMYPVSILNLLGEENKKNNLVDYIKLEKIA